MTNTTDAHWLGNQKSNIGAGLIGGGLPLILSVAVINGYKLKAYQYKLFTFLLNASCLGTFPYLRISLS